MAQYYRPVAYAHEMRTFIAFALKNNASNYNISIYLQSDCFVNIFSLITKWVAVLIFRKRIFHFLSMFLFSHLYLYGICNICKLCSDIFLHGLLASLHKQLSFSHFIRFYLFQNTSCLRPLS